MANAEADALSRLHGSEGGLREEMALAMASLRQQHKEEIEASRRSHDLDRKEASERHGWELGEAAARHRSEVEALRRAAEEQREAAELRMRQNEGDWRSAQEAELLRLKQVSQECARSESTAHDNPPLLSCDAMIKCAHCSPSHAPSVRLSFSTVSRDDHIWVTETA